MLDMAAWADDQGFAYVDFGEHHVTESGYNPSPLVTCAAVAGRTHNIRMRPNVLLAPFYNPVRLAEDTAVLSLVAGGRFDLVLGGGYRQRECDLYGTSLKDRWKTVGDTARFLRQAWTGEPFEYRGQDIAIRPAPDPPPALFLGGYSEAAARRAARIADGFSPPYIEGLWEFFRDERIKRGHPDPGAAQPLGPVFLWVSDNTEDAWDMLMPHLLSQVAEYQQFMTETYGGDEHIPYQRMPTTEEMRQNAVNQVLTPEETIALAEKLGNRGVLYLNPLMDGIAPQEAWRMLRLFETKVLPYLP